MPSSVTMRIYWSKKIFEGIGQKGVRGGFGGDFHEGIGVLQVALPISTWPWQLAATTKKNF